MITASIEDRIFLPANEKVHLFDCCTATWTLHYFCLNKGNFIQVCV